MNTKTLLAVFCSLFVASATWAVPSQLAHQGRLLDVEGAALSGEHSLTFALFDAATEGTEVWSETITVNIVGGFYSVVLGADEGANPLDDLVLGNPPLWLELTVDNGEPLLPRHELLSVPYAVLAGTATNVEGGYVDATEVAVDGTTVIDSSGNWTGPTPATDWSDLSGVPAGLDDGLDADTLAGLSCGDGGVAKFNLGTGLWDCATDSVLSSSERLGPIRRILSTHGRRGSQRGRSLTNGSDSLSLGACAPVQFLRHCVTQHRFAPPIRRPTWPVPSSRVPVSAGLRAGACEEQAAKPCGYAGSGLNRSRMRSAVARRAVAGRPSAPGHLPLAFG